MKLIVFEDGGLHYIAMDLTLANLPRKDGDGIVHRTVIGKRKNGGYENFVLAARDTVEGMRDSKDLSFQFQISQKTSKVATITGDLAKVIRKVRKYEGEDFTIAMDEVEVQLVS